MSKPVAPRRSTLFATCVLLALVGVTLPQNLPAQRLQPAERPVVVDAGRRAADGGALQATRYRPGGRIVDFHVDSIGQTLTLFTRATNKKETTYKPVGRVLQYDLATGDTLWTRAMDYRTEDYHQEGPTMLYRDGPLTIHLDARTRRGGWAVKVPIVTLVAGGRVALSYGAQAGKDKDPDRLRGLDAATGRELWSREVPREYGWDTFREVGDTTLLIVASGFHGIDPLTGAGWSHAAQTGERNVGATVGKSLLAVVTGVVGGVAMVPTDVDRTYGFVSNLLHAGGGYVLASADTLHKFGADGVVRWASPLGAGQPTATVVMTIGDAYVLIGTGSARKGAGRVPHGGVYVAAFDTLTGVRRYLTALDVPAKAQVESLVRRGDGLLLKVGAGYHRIDPATGNTVAARELNAAQAAVMGGFAQAMLYYRDGERFEPAGGADAAHAFAIEKGGNLVEIADDLRTGTRVESARLYRWIGVSGAARLLSDGKDCVLIDGAGAETARLPGGLSSRLVGGRVYAISEDELLVFDTMK